MKKRIVLGLIIALMLGTTGYLIADEPTTVKFTLGGNIVETARGSGVPRFNVEQYGGAILYSTAPFRETVAVIYSRPGYVISVQSVYSFDLWADRHRTPNDTVAYATIMLAGEQLSSHSTGRRIVDSIIAQFNSGKWKRHISPECPAVTGRSSFLNESGAMAGPTGCGIDPNYKFKPDEWLALFAQLRRYEWMGEGTLATLKVSYDQDIRGTTYNVILSFEDYKARLAVDAENEAREIKEGDLKGWKMSERAKQDRKKTAALVKLLEKNAGPRGDAIIPRE